MASKRGQLLLVAAIGLLLGACAAPRSSAPSTAPIVLDVPRNAGVAREHIRPELLPALEALEASVVSGDELEARAILARILARRPTGPALELALAFERILDGRAAVRALELRLEAREDALVPGRYALELVIEKAEGDATWVRPGPARLVRRLVAIQPDGHERREASERPISTPERLVVAPGEPVRVELGVETVPQVPGALAVRCTWELRFLSGEVLAEGRSLPAMRMVAAPASRVLLAAFLPAAPVEPEELARYVREETRVRREAALERAVRVAPSRYGEALTALAAEHERLNLVSLEEISPALRWLAGERAPAGDAEAWRRWLVLHDRPPPAEPSTLDMPRRAP